MQVGTQREWGGEGAARLLADKGEPNAQAILSGADVHLLCGLQTQSWQSCGDPTSAIDAPTTPLSKIKDLHRLCVLEVTKSFIRNNALCRAGLGHLL